MERFEEGFGYAQKGLDSLEALEDKYKPMPIRELRLADGGRVSELKAAYQRYLNMARKQGSKKIIPFEIFAEEFARENFSRGGITDINMEEQIDTPRGDMMVDENIEVADSSLMDAYEIYKFDMMEQGLEPMSLEQFRNQAMAEGKMANMEYREFIWMMLLEITLLMICLVKTMVI